MPAICTLPHHWDLLTKHTNAERKVATDNRRSQLAEYRKNRRYIPNDENWDEFDNKTYSYRKIRQLLNAYLHSEDKPWKGSFVGLCEYYQAQIKLKSLGAQCYV